MLFLVFQPGAHRYAIDASQIAEVLPLVTIKTIARAPEEVAGIFVYRGAPVPVLDLSQLFEGRPAERRLSTRIIIVRCTGGSGDTRVLGLIAERRRRPSAGRPLISSIPESSTNVRRTSVLSPPTLGGWSSVWTSPGS